MNTSYRSLPHALLEPGTSISQSQHPEIDSITLADKAETVLTDFKTIQPFSITSTATIDETKNTIIGPEVLTVTTVNAGDRCRLLLTIKAV